jgi:molybdate/tungstate transport system substrate-binding protein
MRLIWAFLFVFTVLFSGPSSASTEIKVSYPENIRFLMEKFKQSFETANPNVQIFLQSGSSPQQVEQIVSGAQKADVIIVSDDRMTRPQLEAMYSAAPVEFMTDEIALIAGKNAKHFDELQNRTWFQYVLKPEVKVVVPDPANSYAGYRARLVWKLAETWVRHMMLYENMMQKLGSANGSASTISALTTGEADYAFDYATQAKQNGLRAFRFLKYYNLGDPTLAHVYKGAAIEIPAENDQKKILYGEPIIYSIGQLKGSNSIAKVFVDFVAGQEGRAILEQQELTPMVK